MTLADMNSDLNITVDFFRSIRICHGDSIYIVRSANVFPDHARDCKIPREEDSCGIKTMPFATFATIACNYVQTSISAVIIVSGGWNGVPTHLPADDGKHRSVCGIPWQTTNSQLLRKRCRPDPGLLFMPKWKFTHQPLTHPLQGLPLCPRNRCSPFVAGNGQIVI
ncbi:hypothetical protein [Rhizobium sp. SG570]|uniref:hypothetical protein n=1 Tax=Rhizobium sp. SG570 TaxID=2587113 RepID=UPI00144782FC|nr:hypothetical protein [Rhizobium sp. SG570]NKJ34547.1 hypothetical protein [Rhizobium sp. SG570]